MKNKYIAALLALFLGWLGFHKFYLGKWIQGFLYIIFMPIAVFIAVLEGIQYLLNSQEWFDLQFNFEYMEKRKRMTEWEKEGMGEHEWRTKRIDSMRESARNKNIK